MRAGRTGFTTGTCAAAAAKAAVMLLTGLPRPEQVEIALPGGSRVTLAVEAASVRGSSANAAVRKDAGDDPDVTDGCIVTAHVQWSDQDAVTFRAGEGVGTVTKPGLALKPGEPAINPVPRRMISDAVREVTDRGVLVTIAVPGGVEIAKKTFNPRLGVTGGLSILGTSGIVRPFSSDALRDSLKCSLSVARACNVRNAVFVPGRIGERAARNHFLLKEEQLIEVSNEWGFVLDEAAKIDFEGLLVLGHPGKLAKLVAGWWDTHSSKSTSAVPVVRGLAESLLGGVFPESNTVEGLFASLVDDDRRKLGDALAARIRREVHDRICRSYSVAVVLVNLRGDPLGRAGDLTPWKRRTDRSHLALSESSG